jgi:hypothetical protein
LIGQSQWSHPGKDPPITLVTAVNTLKSTVLKIEIDGCVENSVSPRSDDLNAPLDIPRR